MRLYAALILFMILSTACGLQCYSCAKAHPKACTEIITCPESMKSCVSAIVNGYATKYCMQSEHCEKPLACCEQDLCNSAIPAGPSVILLLTSSAIIILFL
ncbi:lymphocyte antigen 6G-like [Toxotes jaculatrix]|uniref:lymphocyte antigen 6G-like n=1 Tax=Toxotes jaculatrix TaxID=941984 RepID=UPI001B3B07EB|nr:lymphocyte antigen 6G-like [Toxotes jaculatrix]